MRRILISVFASLAFARPVAAQPERGVRANNPIAIQRKVALVIGNQAYTRSPLVNPINDASAVAKSLRNLKFDDVVEKHDLNKRQMDEEIDRMATTLRRGDLALFYYAGHGVQANDQNYLIPVDFTGSEADLPYEAYSASRIRDKLENSGARLRILIFDACRNNPFRGKRGDSPGLLPMQSNSEGTFIAYSTADNQTADDNPSDKNGLYTKELLAAMSTAGLELKQIFETAKENVFRATGGRQFPYTYGGIIGQFYFLGPVTIVNNPSPATPPSDLITQEELAFWNGIEKSDPVQLRLYLDRYPNGRFAGIANARLAPAPAANNATALSPPPTKPTPAASPKTPAEVPATAVSGLVRQPTPDPGETKQKDGLTYTWIGPGSFWMGCWPDDCPEDATPRHKVNITRGFWLANLPPTQSAFEKLMGRHTFRNKVGKFPIDGITWTEASAYCGKIGMRLPTEAEWEYVAQGPSHDLAGKTAEWVSDYYQPDYYVDPPKDDPSGPAAGKDRVMRSARSSIGQRDPQPESTGGAFRCVSN